MTCAARSRPAARSSPARLAATTSAVAAALDAAHEAGLVHRDVKPANVLVGGAADEGRIYLTDFGISRRAGGGETMTREGELIGTADFVSPEQVAGDPVDHRSDVYALGAVVHYAATGQSPFPRDSELAVLFAHANAPRPRPSTIVTGLPPGVDGVVARAMAIDPGTATRPPASSPPRWRRRSTAARPQHSTFRPPGIPNVPPASSASPPGAAGSAEGRRGRAAAVRGAGWSPRWSSRSS